MAGGGSSVQHYQQGARLDHRQISDDVFVSAFSFPKRIVC